MFMAIELFHHFQVTLLGDSVHKIQDCLPL
jgi:hypothetical protein